MLHKVWQHFQNDAPISVKMKMLKELGQHFKMLHNIGQHFQNDGHITMKTKMLHKLGSIL